VGLGKHFLEMIDLSFQSGQGFGEIHDLLGVISLASERGLWCLSTGGDDISF
jgi:hypothetical protein